MTDTNSSPIESRFGISKPKQGRAGEGVRKEGNFLCPETAKTRFLDEINDRHTDGQVDRQTDNRQTDRQTLT